MNKDKFEEAIKRELDQGTKETPAQKECIEVLSQLLRRNTDSSQKKQPAQTH